MENKRKRLRNNAAHSEFSEFSEISDSSLETSGGGKARRAALGVECSPRYVVKGWVYPFIIYLMKT